MTKKRDLKGSSGIVTTIYLPQQHRDVMKVLGEGNVSAGIRRLIAAYLATIAAQSQQVTDSEPASASATAQGVDNT